LSKCSATRLIDATNNRKEIMISSGKFKRFAAIAAAMAAFAPAMHQGAVSVATEAQQSKAPGAHPSGKALGLKEAAKRKIEGAFFGGHSSRAGGRTFPGYGWSVAHDRRQAKKRRNQARNRRAQRG
jgi:hypothetical protein